MRAIQPLRAVLVILLAVVVAVVVLARMGTSHGTAAITRPTSTPITSTSVPSSTATTTATTAPTLSTTTTVAPSSVTLLVLNGWTKEHAALYFETELNGFGYDTLAPTDAATDTNKHSALFVVHSAYESNALAIAESLGLSPSVVVAPKASNDSAIPAGDLSKADLVFVVGQDISGRVPPGYSTTTQPTITQPTTTQPTTVPPSSG